MPTAVVDKLTHFTRMCFLEVKPDHTKTQMTLDRQPQITKTLLKTVCIHDTALKIEQLEEKVTASSW